MLFFLFTLFILVIQVTQITSSRTLVVLLGSSNNELLFDRINTATNAISSSSHDVDWFLSGGFTSDKTTSEAKKMQTLISNYKLENSTWNYILDEKAQNTSENLVYLESWLNTLDYSYSNMKLVTSKFHENRAKKMLSKLSKLNKYNWDWISGTLSFHDSYYWESVHIKNVESDIEKAIKNVNNIII
jgi:uncharacterized SAM-binding protein YcdF (DUF218 family)